MPTNVLLVRWKNGWHEVTEPASLANHPRHEAFLALGALQTIEEVNRVAGMQLSVVAYPRTAIAADHDPLSVADRPYRSYQVGDIITVPNYGSGTSGQRVRAITASEDDNGEVTYSPELGDLILEDQERMLQAVKKMADGTLEGDSPVAQPTRVYVAPVVARPVPKAKTGTLTITTTMPYNPSQQSGGLYDIGGPTSATLVTFRATPRGANGAGDGVPNEVYLWQGQGGDGDSEVAVVSMPDNFVADTTYTGTIHDPSIMFNPELFYGVHFKAGGYHPGPIDIEAIFAESGQTYTLEWAVDT